MEYRKKDANSYYEIGGQPKASLFHRSGGPEVSTVYTIHMIKFVGNGKRGYLQGSKTGRGGKMAFHKKHTRTISAQTNRGVGCVVFWRRVKRD